MLRITTPDHAGSRDQAQALADPLADDLTAESVVVDCSALLVATPSFLDELVKQVLQRRNASALEVTDASERARLLLTRAAENSGVGERLRVAVPPLREQIRLASTGSCAYTLALRCPGPRSTPRRHEAGLPPRASAA